MFRRHRGLGPARGEGVSETPVKSSASGNQRGRTAYGLSLRRATPQSAKAFAQQFAIDWIEAWNSGDLERLSDYFSDDFATWAPATSQASGDLTGILTGKTAAMTAWARARTLIPEVRFALISTLVGQNNLTLYYRGIRARLAAETFYFNNEFKILKVVTMLGDPLATWPIPSQ
jgi:hypothetical protein